MTCFQPRKTGSSIFSFFFAGSVLITTEKNYLSCSVRAVAGKSLGFFCNKFTKISKLQPFEKCWNRVKLASLSWKKNQRGASHQTGNIMSFIEYLRSLFTHPESWRAQSNSLCLNTFESTLCPSQNNLTTRLGEFSWPCLLFYWHTVCVNTFSLWDTLDSSPPAGQEPSTSPSLWLLFLNCLIWQRLPLLKLFKTFIWDFLFMLTVKALLRLRWHQFKAPRKSYRVKWDYNPYSSVQELNDWFPMLLKHSKCQSFEEKKFKKTFENKN